MSTAEPPELPERSESAAMTVVGFAIWDSAGDEDGPPIVPITPLTERSLDISDRWYPR